MTASSSAQPYEYQKILPGQIRLFLLYAGKYEDPIRFRLTVHDLNQLPFFTTISHCWGDGHAEQECICEDDDGIRSMFQTSHLCEGLRRARDANQNVFVWTDQICINQQDEEEKAEQVRKMGQIYRQALCCFIWLGEADESTAMAFMIAHVLNRTVLEIHQSEGWGKISKKKRYEILQPVLGDIDGERTRALQKLFERPWFGRVWCFQEIVLSHRAVFACGPHIIDSHDLWQACEAIQAVCDEESYLLQTRKDDKGHMAMLRLMTECHVTCRYEKYASRGFRRPQLKLMDILKCTMNLECRIPLDKIYGMLAIPEDIDPESFPVDYSLHFRDLYASTTRLFVQQYEDLSFMIMITPGPISHQRNQACAGPRNLPSWVPDYQSSPIRNMRLSSLGLNILHGTGRLFNASGGSKARLSEDPLHQLTVSGVLLGRITKTGESGGFLHLDEGAIYSHVETGGSWYQCVQDSAVDGVYPKTGESVYETFARLRISDYLPGEVSPEHRRNRISAAASASSFPEPLRVEACELNPSSRHADGMAKQIISATAWQRLYLTDTGYLGLTDELCEPGDCIYLLMGSDMPCALRKLDTGTYHFVGLSYVHGAMDGEYLLENFKPRCQDAESMSDDYWLQSLSDEPLPFPTKTIVLS